MSISRKPSSDLSPHYELADGIQTTEPGIQKQVAFTNTDIFSLIPLPQRQALAINPNTSHFRLRALTNDPVASVRSRVAQNPAVSGDLLLQLLHDSHPAVRDAARRNPLCWVLHLTEKS